MGKVAEDIREWVKRITLTHEELGGFSICPFAASATYHVEERSLSDVGPLEGFDVAIFVVGRVSLSQMLQRVSELNMMYEDYIFLDDHISEPTYLRGIQTNCGKHNLVIVQKKDKLLKARENLHKTEYFKYWSEEMYNKIIKG